MNRKQMLAEFKRLGGKTKLNAILVSQSHWKMIGRIRYWETLVALNARRGMSIRPSGYNCGMCELYNQHCSKCGLKAEHSNTDPPCSLNYDLALNGIGINDRKQFLRGRRGLLKELATLELKERARLLKRKSK